MVKDIFCNHFHSKSHASHSATVKNRLLGLMDPWSHLTFYVLMLLTFKYIILF